jgi:DNA-binding beta-propeller fold protein YncE
VNLAKSLLQLTLEDNMEKASFCLLNLALAGAVACSVAAGREKQPLELLQTIPLPNVKGRIDHMDVDVKGNRLFIAGLENGSLEVLDLKAGKRTKSIAGFQKPQGIAYVESLKKVFVASGDDGMLRVFRADTLDLLDSIKLDLGPNRVVYDPRTGLVYVGYGGKDAGKDYGEVGIIDGKTDKHIDDIQVAAHPSELLLDASGRTLFVFVSIASQVQVVDTQKRQVTATWPVSSQRNGDGAFDEATKRLFLGTRMPPRMIAMDSTSGKEVSALPTPEGMDGVYFNAKQHRIYISGGRDQGEGFVFIYQQKDADHYEAIASIPTRSGAGTSFWSPDLNRYFVAAPANDKEEAAILVFEPAT